MSKFIKQVVNSVAVQAAAYAVTEGVKVIGPKARQFFKRATDAVGDGVQTVKSKAEFSDVLKNTEKNLRKRQEEQARRAAATPVVNPPAEPPVATPPTTPTPDAQTTFDAKFGD